MSTALMVVNNPGVTNPNENEWEMTRAEYAKYYPDGNYDRMLHRHATLGNITHDEADKRSFTNSLGAKHIWAKTRKEIEREGKEAVKAGRRHGADINKMHSSPAFASWRIKSMSRTAKGDVEYSKQYTQSLLGVHEDRVREALEEGYTVPDAVLKDYPRLKRNGGIMSTALMAINNSNPVSSPWMSYKDEITGAVVYTYRDNGETLSPHLTIEGHGVQIFAERVADYKGGPKSLRYFPVIRHGSYGEDEHTYEKGFKSIADAKGWAEKTARTLGVIKGNTSNPKKAGYGAGLPPEPAITLNDREYSRLKLIDKGAIQADELDHTMTYGHGYAHARGLANANEDATGTQYSVFKHGGKFGVAPTDWVNETWGRGTTRHNPSLESGMVYLWGYHRINGRWERLQGPFDVATAEQYQTYFAKTTLADTYSNVRLSGFANDTRPTYTAFNIQAKIPRKPPMRNPTQLRGGKLGVPEYKASTTGGQLGGSVLFRWIEFTDPTHTIQSRAFDNPKELRKWLASVYPLTFADGVYNRVKERGWSANVSDLDAMEADFKRRAGSVSNPYGEPTGMRKSGGLAYMVIKWIPVGDGSQHTAKRTYPGSKKASIDAAKTMTLEAGEYVEVFDPNTNTALYTRESNPRGKRAEGKYYKASYPAGAAMTLDTGNTTIGGISGYGIPVTILDWIGERNQYGDATGASVRRIKRGTGEQIDFIAPYYMLRGIDGKHNPSPDYSRQNTDRFYECGSGIITQDATIRTIDMFTRRVMKEAYQPAIVDGICEIAKAIYGLGGGKQSAETRSWAEAMQYATRQGERGYYLEHPIIALTEYAEGSHPDQLEHSKHRPNDRTIFMNRTREILDQAGIGYSRSMEPMEGGESGESGGSMKRNSISKGYEHLSDRTRANEVLIAPYINKLKVKDFNDTFILTGVNDVGVLYWSKPKQKKQFALGYTVADLGRLSEGTRNPKSINEMSAAEINREVDKLSAVDSKLTSEMIAAGRGYELPSEYLNMGDPLSMRLRAMYDRRSDLSNEIQRRAGPGMRRLPKGFGPMRHNPDYTYDPTTDPDYRNRTRVRVKQDFLIMLADMLKYPDNFQFTNHAGAPTVDQLRGVIYPEWEHAIEHQINMLAPEAQVGVPADWEKVVDIAMKHPMTVGKRGKRNPALQLFINGKPGEIFYSVEEAMGKGIKSGLPFSIVNAVVDGHDNMKRYGPGGKFIGYGYGPMPARNPEDSPFKPYRNIKDAITAWNNTGRIAFYHPRKKTVSLNGFRDIPEREALKRINELLEKQGTHRGAIPNRNPEDSAAYRFGFAKGARFAKFNKSYEPGDLKVLQEVQREADRMYPEKRVEDGWLRNHKWDDFVGGFHDGFRKAFNAMPTSKQNPEDSAASLYEEFHGRPSTETVEYAEDLHYHGNLAQLGELTEMCVATPTGLDITLSFEDAHTQLASSEDGKQLYFVGGDQSVDLNAFKMDGDGWTKDSMLLGVLYKVTYRTEKGFDKFELTDYFHETGEETGVQPVLVYDTLNSLLSVAGGQYQVKDVGIVN